MYKKEIEKLISSYHWMAKEVQRLQRVLYGSDIPMRSWGVAQYGLEAAMPKGSPGKSQAELRDMDIREERLYKRLEYFEERVYAIEAAARTIEGEQHKVIYDCMTEGMSYRAIGLHLGISRETVRRMKDEIINQLCQNCRIVQLLNPKKSVV
ncbi:sigma factor-like helix-turn-helix DNA-binding protein [Bacillus paralicheniformis]|uniref:sigma factor-like helix-turn-helix DNA-binding protein n=1 Tax=Bacillus subtilis group TaxID=653685 RepID=UPI002B48BAB4|nr:MULTISPECIES: sigma factor-like helix-turn-helix DNA-binding protein [Bacillus subtilis group]MEB3127521.1 sigma factor-like helix-turn-helix DNA-binding protein [Bacillus paralicheniformis]MED1128805.1 sigma factor-like helix-turn-helix DNA-binding protein [Bacillus paralicheniformis]MED1234737.1 sigma factor-like helix-turn-helix DNA-binding protein [Bacillus paralicheniformis]MED4374061.1 sigma factor-like helix-turn-helix DNA-binding protein [Bacillus licheniformis]